MFTLLPAFVLAESPGSDPAPVETPLDVEETDTGESTPEIPDTVIYNLGSLEVTVGHDEFAGDGSFTIELEADAFFPYEVQFQYNGATTTEWFETPESTVEIGGHVFSVRSEAVNPTAITQMGFTIGSDYIPVRPEAKTFTHTVFSFFSLVPLETKKLTIDLTGRTPGQLKNAKLSTIVGAVNVAAGGTPIDGSEAVVWLKKSSEYTTSDNYAVVSDQSTATIDLTPTSNSAISVTLDMIVGTADQLDETNIRYIVKVDVTPFNDFLMFELYTKDNPSQNLTINSFSYNADSSRYALWVNPPFTEEALTRLGMSLGSSFTGFTAKVYKGKYESVAEITTALSQGYTSELTSLIWDQTMSDPSAGYDDDDPKDYRLFTLVLEKGGEVTDVFWFWVICYPESNSISFSRLWNSDGSSSYSSYSSAYNGGTRTYTITMPSGTSASADYSACFYYFYRGTSDITHITKAVVGHFDTLEAATALPDIKDKLLPSNPYTYSPGMGHTANYSGEGVKFTVFDDEGGVFKVIVKTVDGAPEDINRPSGSEDTNFRITGADGISSSNQYVVPYNHDSYYRNGYQTVLVLDKGTTNLGALKPTFWNASTAKVFAGDPSKQQTSGSSQHDFSGGPVQYSVSAENKTNSKNYWVTFVEKYTGGSKLFVNGVNGPDGAKRQIFLNGAYDYVHDIFIANVGDAELTGLSVELNATNVKLDDYWTINDGSVGTLGAFTTVTTASGSKTGEIPSVAKIRLIPDGSGLIDGTLTIKAAGQPDVVIQLTGVAGDPMITTKTIPDAVKYVPYGTMIQTSNMFDWNTPSFSLQSGRLPQGVELKANGEIYGAPLETGTFTFSVRMRNSYTSFADSVANFTLVVAENTDANVDGASDPEYPITTRVDRTIYDTQDKRFVVGDTASVGNSFGDYMLFRLDGQILTEGVDYTVESGSTVITIKAQTLQAAGEGEHTIAAEYRSGKDTEKQLYRAAQNYTLQLSGEGSDSTQDGDGGSSSSTGAGLVATTRTAPAPLGSGSGMAVGAYSPNPNSPDHKDLVVTMDLNGQLLMSITNGNTTLLYGADFTSEGNVFTIKQGYLATLSPGVHTLRFNLANGSNVVLAIAVYENGIGIYYPVLSSFSIYDGNGDVTVRIDAEFSKFTGMLYSGLPLDPSNYTAVSGSTVITLHPEFLETLSDGLHIFRANFDDGYTDLLLRVRRNSKGSSNVPQTGDAQNVMVWAIVLAAAIVLMAGALVWRRVRKAKGTW